MKFFDKKFFRKILLETLSIKDLKKLLNLRLENFSGI
jgi:hypothetical protein